MSTGSNQTPSDDAAPGVYSSCNYVRLGNAKKMGEFSENELLGLITELVSADFPGAPDLRTQIPGLRMSAQRDGDGSRHLYPTQGRPARVRYQIPVEAEYTDRRGHLVNVLLFVDGKGRLALLELYTIGVNEEDDRVDSLPEPGTATIHVGPGPAKQAPLW